MIEKFAKECIDKCLTEINKPDNKKKIETELINPLFTSFTDRIYPYVSLLFIMYTLTLILIVIILILIIYNKKNN